MKSMTGYGRGRASADGRDIVVEVRAVNHRYLDVSVKAPRSYGFLEEALKKQASARMNRGKVDILVSVNETGARQTTVALDLALARQYLDALNELRDALHLHDDVSVMNLARLPDVLTSERAEVDAEELTKAVCAVFGQAADVFDAMREHEGSRMAADITGRMQAIRALVGQVEVRSPERVEAYRARLQKRMQEILGDNTADPQRILTEAAIFADKTAVDEETVRLRSHLDQLEQMLADAQPVGRKMDFLVQEMNREANTIGSKANDTQTARLVIDLKAEIEKIREQVQNIE